MKQSPLASKLIAALALFVTVAGCRKGADTAEDTTPKPIVQVTVTTAEEKPLQTLVEVSGTLSPMPDMEAKIAPLAAGRIKKVFVKPGDLVSKGQVVATLDPGPLLGQIQQSEAAIKNAEAALKQARLNHRSQVAAQRTSVEQARQNLEAQQVALSKLRAGARPEEITQAQSALTTADAALTNAQQNLSRTQTLFSEGLMARKDLEAAQAAEQTARAQVSSAESALALVKKGNRPQDIRAGEIAVRQAEEQLRAAQQQEIQNAAKAQDVAIAQAQLQSAIGTLNSNRAQLASLTIRSPLAGTVVGRTVNAGESIDVTGSIATVVNLAKVRLLLSVPLAQLQDVRVGQRVEFTVESDPEARRHAIVSVVSRAVDASTNTVQVEAEADNADRKLRDDGLVKAGIITAEKPRAVVVPTDAVVDKDGKLTCFVVGADKVVHATAVVTGLRQGNSLEVLSGVHAGDKVVATGAYELEDGTKVETGDDNKPGKSE